MLCKKLAPMLIPLFISAAASAAPQASGRADTPEKAAKPEKAAQLSQTLSVLHAVSQWGNTLSAMADERAKSDLVKNYAREMMTTNKKADAKLRSIAENNQIRIAPLNPRTEAGKSLLDRMKAEKVLLGSLKGDAFDKEYMTLVTNTQQSVIHLLETSEASATDPAVKQLLGDLTATVKDRLQKAQEIMAKIYGDNV
jgi:predicted outer membrane protein